MRAIDIIEYSSRGKVTEAANEDALVITDDFIAVIDGSTSKGTLAYPCKSGKMARQILSEAIQKMKHDLNMSEAASYLTERIRSYYDKNGLTDIVAMNTADRITASAVIYSAFRNEIWQIGDCPCLVDGILYENQKYWEQPLAEIRSLFLEKELASGKAIEELRADDTGRRFILELLKFSTQYQNNPYSEYGYAVIDGFRIPQKYLKSIPLGDSNEIVLASDGYISLKGTLQDSERYNAFQKEQDPLCIHEHKMTKGLWPGAENFDDRTYIRFRTRMQEGCTAKK